MTECLQGMHRYLDYSGEFWPHMSDSSHWWVKFGVEKSAPDQILPCSICAKCGHDQRRGVTTGTQGCKFGQITCYCGGILSRRSTLCEHQGEIWRGRVYYWYRLVCQWSGQRRPKVQYLNKMAAFWRFSARKINRSVLYPLFPCPLFPILPNLLSFLSFMPPFSPLFSLLLPFLPFPFIALSLSCSIPSLSSYLFSSHPSINFFCSFLSSPYFSAPFPFFPFRPSCSFPKIYNEYSSPRIHGTFTTVTGCSHLR